MSPLRTNVVDLFREAKERALPNFVPVNPVAAKASSQLKDHPAKAAIDGLRNTYWAEGAKGTGEKQFLTITFAGPSDLARIIITSGASSKPEEFRAQPRPHTLHLVFSDATTTDLTLEDTPDPQDFAIDVTGVTSVEIHIASVYRSIKGTAASIAEIEFRRRT